MDPNAAVLELQLNKMIIEKGLKEGELMEEQRKHLVLRAKYEEKKSNNAALKNELYETKKLLKAAQLQIAELELLRIKEATQHLRTMTAAHAEVDEVKKKYRRAGESKTFWAKTASSLTNILQPTSNLLTKSSSCSSLGAGSASVLTTPFRNAPPSTFEEICWVKLPNGEKVERIVRLEGKILNLYFLDDVLSQRPQQSFTIDKRAEEYTNEPNRSVVINFMSEDLDDFEMKSLVIMPDSQEAQDHLIKAIKDVRSQSTA